jgi:hypothetical protein
MRFIDKFKNVFKGREAFILGTGPSADKYDEKDSKDNVLIGINRAICLSENFDFIFIDNLSTLKDIMPYQKNTEYILMPLFSVGKNNYDEIEKLRESESNPNLLECYNKIVYFIWAHKMLDALNLNKSGLNDNFLFIDWGNVQSAVHFVSKIGVREITFYGVDGGCKQGFSKEAINYHAKKVIECFGKTKQPLTKLDQNYKSTKDLLSEIADKLSVKMSFKQ